MWLRGESDLDMDSKTYISVKWDDAENPFVFNITFKVRRAFLLFLISLSQGVKPCTAGFSIFHLYFLQVSVESASCIFENS